MLGLADSHGYDQFHQPFKNLTFFTTKIKSLGSSKFVSAGLLFLEALLYCDQSLCSNGNVIEAQKHHEPVACVRIRNTLLLQTVYGSVKSKRDVAMSNVCACECVWSISLG